MKFRFALKCAIAVTLLLNSSSYAGSVSNGTWSAGGCGAKPEAPAIDAKNEKTYNAGVDATNAYLLNIRTYIDCVAAEANEDINIIAQSANAVQQTAAQVREKLLADVNAGAAKLK